jgi:lysophospholipid acyltransferase (LPLAT)-like uncharacterized protein
MRNINKQSKRNSLRSTIVPILKMIDRTITQKNNKSGDPRVCWHMVVGFTPTYALYVHHHESYELVSNHWEGVLDTTLFDSLSVSCGRSVGFSRYS